MAPRQVAAWVLCRNTQQHCCRVLPVAAQLQPLRAATRLSPPACFQGLAASCPNALCTAICASMQDAPRELPPALHKMLRECYALQSWLRSLDLANYVPTLRLSWAARRPEGGSAAPAVQCLAAHSGDQAGSEQWRGAGGAAAWLEPVEHSLRRALGGAEILDLEPAAEQPNLLVAESSSVLCAGPVVLERYKALQVAVRLELIGCLLAEAAAAAGASAHVLHTLACYSGRQIACVAPDSVWVLTIDASD